MIEHELLLLGVILWCFSLPMIILFTIYLQRKEARV
jgi:hypothetical protein